MVAAWMVWRLYGGMNDLENVWGEDYPYDQPLALGWSESHAAL